MSIVRILRGLGYGSCMGKKTEGGKGRGEVFGGDIAVEFLRVSRSLLDWGGGGVS